MRLNNWSIAASYDTARIGSREPRFSVGAQSRRASANIWSRRQPGYGADLPRCRHQSNDSNHRGSNWWGDLPTSMKEAIDRFRVQLGEAIDSVEFVKRLLTRRYQKLHGRP